MAKVKKERPPCIADTRGAGFVGIPQVVIKSEAYKTLSLRARAVLVEMVAVSNGYNNGNLAISLTQICERLSNSNRGATSRAIAELMEHGLVDLEVEGSFARQRAREYRLTFISTFKGNIRRPATNDYLSWKKSGGDSAAPQMADRGNGGSPRRGLNGKASLPRLFAHRQKTVSLTRDETPVAVKV